MGPAGPVGVVGKISRRLGIQTKLASEHETMATSYPLWSRKALALSEEVTLLQGLSTLHSQKSVTTCYKLLQLGLLGEDVSELA